MKLFAQYLYSRRHVFFCALLCAAAYGVIFFLYGIDMQAVWYPLLICLFFAAVFMMAGYFRMKNITLGYTLPQHITQKAAIQKLRFYISANDLFCISNYPKGWDPEVGTSTYPITTTVVGGVQINF